MGLKMTTRDAVRLAAELNLWDVETRQGGDVFRKDGAVMEVYYAYPSGRLQGAYCDSRDLPSPLKPAILDRLARTADSSTPATMSRVCGCGTTTWIPAWSVTWG
jgi:hypothetical protein